MPMPMPMPMPILMPQRAASLRETRRATVERLRLLCRQKRQHPRRRRGRQQRLGCPAGLAAAPTAGAEEGDRGEFNQPQASSSRSSRSSVLDLVLAERCHGKHSIGLAPTSSSEERDCVSRVAVDDTSRCVRPSAVRCRLRALVRSLLPSFLSCGQTRSRACVRTNILPVDSRMAPTQSGQLPRPSRPWAATPRLLTTNTRQMANAAAVVVVVVVVVVAVVVVVVVVVVFLIWCVW